MCDWDRDCDMEGCDEEDAHGCADCDAEWTYPGEHAGECPAQRKQEVADHE